MPCHLAHADPTLFSSRRKFYSLEGQSDEFSFRSQGVNGVNLHDAYNDNIWDLGERYEPMYLKPGPKVTYIMNLENERYSKQKHAINKQGSVTRGKAVKQIAEVAFDFFTKKYGRNHAMIMLKSWSLLGLKRVNTSAYFCILANKPPQTPPTALSGAVIHDDMRETTPLTCLHPVINNQNHRMCWSRDVEPTTVHSNPLVKVDPDEIEHNNAAFAHSASLNTEAYPVDFQAFSEGPDLPLPSGYASDTSTDFGFFLPRSNPIGAATVVHTTPSNSLSNCSGVVTPDSQMRPTGYITAHPSYIQYSGCHCPPMRSPDGRYHRDA